MPETMPTPTSSRLFNRPRGLWKHARDLSSAAAARTGQDHSPPPSTPDFESDTSDNPSSTSSSLSTLPLKQFKDIFDDSEDASEVYYFEDFSSHKRHNSPFPTVTANTHRPRTTWSSRRKIMTTSTATLATTSITTNGDSNVPNHEDWEDLKDLFARATEQYEGVHRRLEC
jgi:hypothetical protein